MIKAILLDFNGVIIDDEPIQMMAYRDVLVNEGIDLTEDKYYACLGMNDRVFLETIFRREGKEVSGDHLAPLIEAKTANWRDRIQNEIPLFEGVAEFVKRIKNDFELGLVSMARRPEIEYVLDKTGLESCFSIVISAEDVTTTKPDPECYRKGFSLIDSVVSAGGNTPITRQQCVVIEDSPPGIAAGRKAGLRTLGVTNTVEAGRLREAGADYVTESLSDWYPDSFREVYR